MALPVFIVDGSGHRISCCFSADFFFPFFLVWKREEQKHGDSDHNYDRVVITGARLYAPHEIVNCYVMKNCNPKTNDALMKVGARTKSNLILYTYLSVASFTL